MHKCTRTTPTHTHARTNLFVLLFFVIVVVFIVDIVAANIDICIYI